MYTYEYKFINTNGRIELLFWLEIAYGDDRNACITHPPTFFVPKAILPPS